MSEGSAYGAGSADYADTDLQRRGIQGRLSVSTSIRDRYRACGDRRRAEKWGRIVDELLDKLLEVRGK